MSESLSSMWPRLEVSFLSDFNPFFIFRRCHWKELQSNEMTIVCHSAIFLVKTSSLSYNLERRVLNTFHYRSLRIEQSSKIIPRFFRSSCPFAFKTSPDHFLLSFHIRAETLIGHREMDTTLQSFAPSFMGWDHASELACIVKAIKACMALHKDTGRLWFPYSISCTFLDFGNSFANSTESFIVFIDQSHIKSFPNVFETTSGY